MKIALISEHASPLAAFGGVDAGGQNVHVAELSSALARQGHDVIVYTRRSDPASAARTVLPDGVRLVNLTAGPVKAVPKDLLLPYMDEFAHNLREDLRRERPALVHAHFWMSGRASLAAAHPMGIPVVQTFHALGIEKRRFQGHADTSPSSRLAQESEIVRRCDYVIATSRSEVDELSRMGLEAERVRVIPCGVNLAQFDRCRSVFAQPRRARRRIVTLSRLVERKGIADVIRALPRLHDAELIVAGGGDARELETDPEYRRLLAIARELGVCERVVMHGRVERHEVPGLLRSADCVVCVPWYEPFGIVPLEAMACRVPVVASAVGGLNDTVVHGETGYHVSPRSPEQVAAAVETLLHSVETRRRFGEAGRDRVVARYTWEQVARATVDAYLECLDSARLDSIA